VVTHVNSPSNFFIQRCDDNTKLGKLFKTINKVAKNSESEIKPLKGMGSDFFLVNLFFLYNIFSTFNFFSGEVYLCQFTVDENWYRAEIMELKPCDIDLCIDCPKQVAKVFYIDYGNDESVHFDR